MKEKTLFKLSIICSIIGMVVLFFISNHMEIKEIDVSNIDSTDIGKEVKVLGEVMKVSDLGNVMFLEIGQVKIEKVDVVLFKEEDIRLKQGDYVELIGELNEYNGDISIIANCVKVR